MGTTMSISFSYKNNLVYSSIFGIDVNISGNDNVLISDKEKYM